ncbi:UDP-diphospho-muramoylpentapeptide beta-N-acetylglucosaminyltransferase [Flavobacterium akiainvivens]|uniref:UDP-N-acetylglucosamine--N-acetylmuramyl-(pentapeptide) pyrophosphoryl-undecaprenol N-acetylglucosamine transferase n=1 Tax=Flavobacterium akiainvivens TaxID=1202724 RepID=A0A0M9VJI5_9FLAO|nr:undecaprenyldiphospho-muramoylpentapeptide beta-N-acetylglucosaminyltransferase [Flavobacterium akiainvivens]KOS07509.1 UDP-diphospho-muramoylpentapeptide beta-N-acetylglucosaminyltransferase [Flavobacterium akiainvivens]SFQ63794.1 UDP-N-acetylglucosamine-N-acetylmuramylpentapeptide N-acetylglucosamine transferase [Flavobacterium akiainvivens]
MGNKRFILSGGGTGGHIYPAVAIANGLKERFPDCEILFVGASDKMEMQKVPQAGYKIEGLWIAGIQRRLTLDNAMFPLKLMSSLIKSRKIVKKFKPDVVIGTGGFASGPLLRAAAGMGVPTVIQEQNSYPGITNKWLSKFAKKICVAYDNLERFFPAQKIVHTGNPVRSDLIGVEQKRAEAITKFNLDPNKKTLLVLGGSLGSRRINQLIAKELVWLQAQNVQVIWQCGKFYFEEYRHYGDKDDVQVLSFIDRMDLVYAAADVVISRSGASSVSELCIVGKPVLFIPSPNVAEDHQTKNAQAIVDKEGALLLKEAQLDTQFQPLFEDLLSNDDKRQKLGENIKKLAKINATQDIVEEIVKLLK